jgi:hypothetical protein
MLLPCSLFRHSFSWARIVRLVMVKQCDKIRKALFDCLQLLFLPRDVCDQTGLSGILQKLNMTMPCGAQQSYRSLFTPGLAFPCRPLR